MCGEKCEMAASSKAMVGSPPRVRGKAGSGQQAAGVAGITPACAGKSAWGQLALFGSGDHPRVCGEKWYIHQRCWRRIGSPPRVRGKGRFPSFHFCRGSITPACAGKRRKIGVFSRKTRDHPRVCGEKSFLPCVSSLYTGSPPRVRGKDPELLKFFKLLGITPACAGKSSSLSTCSRLM